MATNEERKRKRDERLAKTFKTSASGAVTGTGQSASAQKRRKRRDEIAATVKEARESQLESFLPGLGFGSTAGRDEEITLRSPAYRQKNDPTASVFEITSRPEHEKIGDPDVQKKIRDDPDLKKKLHMADPGRVPLANKGNRSPVQPGNAMQGRWKGGSREQGGLIKKRQVRRDKSGKIIQRREQLFRRDPFGGAPAIEGTRGVQNLLEDMKSGPDPNKVVSSGAKIRAQKQAEEEFELQQARQKLGVVPPPPGRGAGKGKAAGTPEQQAEKFKNIGDRFGHAWKMDDIGRAREHIEDWFDAGGNWDNMPPQMEYLARQIVGAQGGETAVEKGLAAEEAGEVATAAAKTRAEERAIAAGGRAAGADIRAQMGDLEGQFETARVQRDPEGWKATAQQARVLAQEAGVPEDAWVTDALSSVVDPWLRVQSPEARKAAAEAKTTLEAQAKAVEAQTLKNQTAAVTAIREQWTGASKVGARNPVAQQEIYEQAKEIYGQLPPSEQRRLDKIMKGVERREAAGKTAFALPDEAIKRYRKNVGNAFEGKGIMAWDEGTGRLNLLGVSRTGKEDAVLPDFEPLPPDDKATATRQDNMTKFYAKGEIGGKSRDKFILHGGKAQSADVGDKQYVGIMSVYRQQLKAVMADRKRFKFSEKAAERMAQESFLSAVAEHPHIVKALTGPSGPEWARTGKAKKNIERQHLLDWLRNVPTGGEREEKQRVDALLKDLWTKKITPHSQIRESVLHFHKEAASEIGPNASFKQIDARAKEMVTKAMNLSKGYEVSADFLKQWDRFAAESPFVGGGVGGAKTEAPGVAGAGGADPDRSAIEAALRAARTALGANASREEVAARARQLFGGK